ncbi:hypothetical protein HanLR1_Chr16g0606451 [Helianthus annuus]|nr:hypothetical protein HanHA89_Chr16g0645331 [Helianthus annuus]KAJ0639677.1 hypothetical protein HanLR1_Chr16g0606451 [Helianthus annuus]
MARITSFFPSTWRLHQQINPEASRSLWKTSRWHQRCSFRQKGRHVSPVIERHIDLQQITGADRQELHDFSNMDEYRRATCTTILTKAEGTKRIFPLVGQLAPNSSWQGCSSLLHPPAINRTLHHSGP